MDNPLIVLHTGSENEWIPDVALVFQSKCKTGDYYGRRSISQAAVAQQKRSTFSYTQVTNIPSHHSDALFTNRVTSISFQSFKSSNCGAVWSISVF